MIGTLALAPDLALAARAQAESLRLAVFVAVVEIVEPGRPPRSALTASPCRLRSHHRGESFVAVGEQFRAGVRVAPVVKDWTEFGSD